MSQEQFIQNLLKLKDPNIEFQSVKTDENSVFITAKLAPNCSKCRYCGESGLLRNGTKVVNIRIPNINERNAILKLRKQRYLCPKCHHTVIAQTPLVRPHHQISERTRHAIMIALTEDRNVTSIAQQFNVSPVSVNRIIDDLGPQIKSRPDDLPKVLCFDEFRSTQRQMSFIALNGETHELVTLLPGRRNQEIIQYFTRHYSLKNRQTVQYVVIDFNAQYQSAIRQLFPKAKIVADNFHLVQMTLQALNQTRVQLMKKYPHTSKAYRLLKHNWRLYLMNYNRLEQRKPQWFAHLRDHLTQEQLDKLTKIEYLCVPANATNQKLVYEIEKKGFTKICMVVDPVLRKRISEIYEKFGLTLPVLSHAELDSKANFAIEGTLEF